MDGTRPAARSERKPPPRTARGPLHAVSEHRLHGRHGCRGQCRQTHRPPCPQTLNGITGPSDRIRSRCPCHERTAQNTRSKPQIHSRFAVRCSCDRRMHIRASASQQRHRKPPYCGVSADLRVIARRSADTPQYTWCVHAQHVHSFRGRPVGSPGRCGRSESGPAQPGRRTVTEEGPARTAPDHRGRRRENGAR